LEVVEDEGMWDVTHAGTLCYIVSLRALSWMWGYSRPFFRLKSIEPLLERMRELGEDYRVEQRTARMI
jgi:hypothetical protein